MASKTIFVTGGAGVLGGALIDSLASEYTLICLTRKSAIRDPRVETVHGDITEPNFGWTKAAFRSLAQRIDWIIHAAAVTRLDGNEEEIFSTNYFGCQNILAFAEMADVPLYHISTAYTHPCDYYEGVSPATPYEDAKRQAEKLVLDSGLRTAIFRPSIIIGDSKSGSMPNFQGFHLNLGLAASGVLPIVPCPEGAFVDVIARDVVANAIKSALDKGLIGTNYFLTSGDTAPQISSLLELLCDAAAAKNTPFTRPKCMHPDIFDRLIKPVFLSTFPEALRPALLRASFMTRYACLRTPLPSSLEKLLTTEYLKERSALQELRASIEFMTPRLRAFTRLMRAPARKVVDMGEDSAREFA